MNWVLRSPTRRWMLITNVAVAIGAGVIAWRAGHESADDIGRALLIAAAVPGVLGTVMLAASLFPGMSDGVGSVRTDWQRGNAPWGRQVDLMEGHLDGVRLGWHFFTRGWLFAAPGLLAGWAVTSLG